MPVLVNRPKRKLHQSELECHSWRPLGYTKTHCHVTTMPERAIESQIWKRHVNERNSPLCARIVVINIMATVTTGLQSFLLSYFLRSLHRDAIPSTSSGRFPLSFSRSDSPSFTLAGTQCRNSWSHLLALFHQHNIWR